MPTLNLSIELASKQPGTQIIFFTSADCSDTEFDESYNKIAQNAKLKNVILNFLVMGEKNYKLALLSQITNGDIFLANQYDLCYKLHTIIQKRIIARNLSVKLISNHKYIYIRDDEFDKNEALAFNYKSLISEIVKKSSVSKNIDFLFQDTELTFEFGLKNKGPNYKKDIIELPFQIQITYETEKGAKIVRAVTKLHKFTNDREIAENCLLSSELILLNACHKVTKSIMNSNISYAKHKAKVKEILLQKLKIFIPECYQDTFDMIRNLSNEKTYNEIDDVDIELLYSYSKVSSKIFKINDLI